MSEQRRTAAISVVELPPEESGSAQQQRIKELFPEAVILPWDEWKPVVME